MPLLTVLNIFFSGFLGKNCEVDIDACALPNNTCPPKTRCLDLSYGLEYTCRVPCPQNLQVGEKSLISCLSSSAALYPLFKCCLVHV